MLTANLGFFLLLVFTTDHGGIATEKLPYNSLEECQIAAMEINNEIVARTDLPRVRLRWACKKRGY